jgi:hypothetical protein
MLASKDYLRKKDGNGSRELQNAKGRCFVWSTSLVSRRPAMHRGTRYKFGYRIPCNYNEAMQFDLRNGNALWREATNLEMSQLAEYDTFRDLGHKDTAPPPTGYKKIRTHIVYDCKHDGRHKARMVADGHLTDILLESVYSGVVSLRGLRIVTFLSELNGLDLWATDIGNAYLEAFTMERNYTVAGPEFGQLEGHYLIIVKALYVVYARLDYVGMNALPIVSTMKASHLARQNLISG